MSKKPYFWDEERILRCTRWYLNNVLWRPVDDNGIPVAPAPASPLPRRDARHNVTRYWRDYLGVPVQVLRPFLTKRTDDQRAKLEREKARHGNPNNRPTADRD